MPLSRDPEKRAAQLANLKPGRGAGDGGLQRSRKHGAYAVIAASEMDAKVREVYEAIGADLPVRDPDGSVPGADAIPLRLLSETLIRRERVRESELKHGVETPDGRLRGIVELGLRLDAQALKLCEQMGLTPASRVRIGVALVHAQSASDKALDADLAASREAWERHDGNTIDGDAEEVTT